MTLSSIPGLAPYDDESFENNDYEHRILPDHASQTFESVQQAGRPALPLDFPTPTVQRAAFVHATAMDHRQGRVVYNVSMLMARSSGSDRAYLVKKTISKSVYGCIKLCVVLKRRRHKFEFTEADYISTDELVALKASSWAKIRQCRGRHLEDPLKEAAALQHVGNYHANILGCLEVLQDDEYLYTVMPYCSGGDLYSFIRNQKSSRTTTASSDNSTISSHGSSSHTPPPRHPHHHHCPDEKQARIWFRQLLEALLHFQKKVDFGLALRVPYVDSSNYEGISDVSEGTSRLLIKAQGQSGTLTYLAPEIIEREEAFDGFAADLWSCGVLLFIFLVGLAPFKWPNSTDYCYAQINRGKLKELLASNLASSSSETISDEACDLLQNMLWRNPRKRLTLAQVLRHPWVVAADSTAGDDSESTQTPVKQPARTDLIKRSPTASSFEKLAVPVKGSPIQLPHTVTTTRLDL